MNGGTVQDAESLFKRDEGKKRPFTCGKKNIEVWDLSGFEIDNSPHKLRASDIMKAGKKTNAGCGW